LNHRRVLTILAIDDYEAGCYALTRTLEKAGFDVLSARTGADALRLARQRPDVIVLDIDLPGLS
jgi:CheY-like chemotaxis protein